MTTLLKNILNDSVGRIFALIFLGLLLFALLLVLFGYRYTNTLQQSNELEKLQMIASTAQINLNGADIDYLLKHYPKKDEIQINQQDAIYKKLSNYLLDVKMANDLSSDISILTQKGDSLYYVVSSAKSPSYLHNYQQAPKEIFRNWSIGGNCPKYKDEKGIWLSAFAPIRNARGLVTSIILVDLNFDVFMQRSKQRLYLFLAASLALLTLIGFILLVQIKTILDRESTLKNELLRNKNLLETRNNETVSSIYYAKQIQNSVLPKPKRLKLCFDQSFVINKPLNIVGGDFWFYERINDKTIVIMADCTRHGVPGAFMSLIGYNIIYDIVKNKKVTDASEILKQLDQGITAVLSEEDELTKLRDGMDVSCVVIDKKEQKLSYSGAYRPLIFLESKTNKITEIKGQRFSLGYTYAGISKDYKTHYLHYSKDDSFYLFSDGITDQFGGERNKKLGLKTFISYLQEVQIVELDEQKNILSKKIKNWQGNKSQIDDMLILGFKL